jgi:hypothetical protein
MDGAAKDVLKLARAGARMLASDHAADVADKKKEMSQLKSAATALHKLADKHDFTEPVEFNYTHTARKPSRGLVTKTAELVLAEAAEATKAATVIEARTETWGKLREEMQGVMKVQQDELDEMRRKLPAFVKASDGLLQHVFATLY